MAECGMCTIEGQLLPACDDVSSLPEPGWRQVIDGMVVDVEMAARATIPDSLLRAQYSQHVRAAADELVAQVLRGELTPRQAVELASRMRNVAMESVRAEASSFGTSIARWLKEEGLGLATLQEKYAQRQYGRAFSALDEAARDQVWLTITRRAGATNARVNFVMRWAPRAGRVFLVASVAIAVYQIGTAHDRVAEAKKQGGALAGGVLGGALAGGMTGLVCGPGAPVCSGILVFVGGVLGAFGGEAAMTSLWK